MRREVMRSLSRRQRGLLALIWAPGPTKTLLSTSPSLSCARALLGLTTHYGFATIESLNPYWGFRGPKVVIMS